MYLEKLAPAWREFHHKLLSQTRILIVDDEPVIQELIGTLLRREGFEVTTADTARGGWERLTSERLDLAIIDKNLPDESGLTLIKRIRTERLAVPSVLITGYATTETVAEALEAGASDYISKPFDDIWHLVARLRSVLDRRISRLLFDVMVRDLTTAVQGGAMESRTYAQLSRELIAFKMTMGRRPEVLIADDDNHRADALATELRAGAISSIIADSESELLSLVSQEHGPLVVVLALERPGAVELVRTVRSHDPQLELLATAEKVNLKQTLDAMANGAADFVLRRTEGPAATTLRVRRLLRRARRHRLYLHLVAMLYRAAKEANPDLADNLVFAAPEADADYVRRALPTEAELAEPHPASLSVDYIEGSRIAGNPFGDRPLRRED